MCPNGLSLPELLLPALIDFIQESIEECTLPRVENLRWQYKEYDECENRRGPLRRETRVLVRTKQ